MAFGAGLGSFGSGVVQGVDQGQNIRAKAMQIQQAQLALDQAKKQVAADAAAFSGIPGAQAMGAPGAGGAQQAPMGLPGPQMPPPPPPTAQPMPPGQSSQPAVPPQPGASPAAPPSSGAAQPAPPAQAGGGSLQPQQGQPGQQQIDPTDPRAAVQTVMSIAQEIKSRNPNIDPTTLLLATQRIIDMSKGLAPALRQGAQVVIQDLKDQTANRNTDVRATQSDTNNQRTTQTSASNTAARGAVQERGQNIGLQKTKEQATAAMQRVQAVQGALNQRFASGQGNTAQAKAMTERGRAIAAELISATRQLGLLKDAAGQPLPDTDPRVQQASKAIAAATAKLDILEKAAGAGAASAAPAAGGPAAGGGQRGSAPATLKGKPIWPQGGKWVYEDGSEAK